MSTVLDLCQGAAEDIRAVAGGETLSAQDAASILSALNDMGYGFDAKEIHVGWSDVALTDDFPLDLKHREGLRAMLAERIADSFGQQVPPQVSRRASLGWQLLKADYSKAESVNSLAEFGLMPSQRRFGW